MLQRVVVCCRVLQCAAAHCSALPCTSHCSNATRAQHKYARYTYDEPQGPHSDRVCSCSVLHCVATCCSVLQRVAVCCSVLRMNQLKTNLWCCTASSTSTLHVHVYTCTHANMHACMHARMTYKLIHKCTHPQMHRYTFTCAQTYRHSSI